MSKRARVYGPGTPAFYQTGGRKETRRRLLRERPWCHWCKRPFTERMDKFGRWLDGLPTIEHVVPKSDGGTDCYSNLALACGKCNHTRNGGYPPHLIVEEIVMRAIKQGYRRGTE